MEALAKAPSDDELSEDELTSAAGGGKGWCWKGIGVGWGEGHSEEYWCECYTLGSGDGGKWKL
ncbi:MAG TPA: hypothetical protein DCL38_06445 [Lachnospiraceae bacterium]|nr:hypothetical protein [Lachnospiraceae bacterium]